MGNDSRYDAFGTLGVIESAHRDDPPSEFLLLAFRDVRSGADIFNEVEAGLKVAYSCRKYGLNSWTVYAWRKKYQGMSVSEAKKLKALDENRRL